MTTIPLDGRITSLEVLPLPLTGSEVQEIVSPGNAASGNNYQVTLATLATYFATGGGLLILAASAVEAPSGGHTGDTSLTSVATVVVPASTIGLNGRLRITALYRYTGTAGTKTPSVTFGGTTFYAAPSLAATLMQRFQIEIANRNSLTSQVGVATTLANGGWSLSSSDIVTASIDTAAAQNLVFSGQLAAAGDSFALESYLIEVLRPPGG